MPVNKLRSINIKGALRFCFLIEETQCLPHYIRIGWHVNQQKEHSFASNDVIVQITLIIILVMSKHETVVQ